MYACSVAQACLFVTPLTAAHQAPLSTELSRQEYWSGVPFPHPGIFSTQGLNMHLLHWQTDPLPLSHLKNPYTTHTFPLKGQIGQEVMLKVGASCSGDCLNKSLVIRGLPWIICGGRAGMKDKPTEERRDTKNPSLSRVRLFAAPQTVSPPGSSVHLLRR